MTHPIAVVGYELQEVEGLVAAVHFQVQLPGRARVAAEGEESR